MRERKGEDAMAGIPVEGEKPLYTRKRRVAIPYYAMAIFALVTASFASAMLFSSGGFDSILFTEGLVAGLLAVVYVLVDLGNLTRKGKKHENMVLIGPREIRPLILIMSIFVLMVILNIVDFFFGYRAVFSFMLGLISSWPAVLVVGTLSLEARHGKIYMVY